MAAKTPQGPPSCCTRPIDVSESGLNLTERLSQYQRTDGKYKETEKRITFVPIANKIEVFRTNNSLNKCF